MRSVTGPEDAGAGGFAIPLILMVLLAATAFGHLLHYLAHQELTVARAERDLLIARLAAEGGVRAVTGTATGLLAAVPVGDSTVVEGAHGQRGAYRVAAHRLTREIHLLAGEGLVNGAARAKVGRLTWALDAGARISTFPAAVAARASITVTDSARIAGDRVTAAPLAWGATECAPQLPVADSIFPHGVVAESGRWVPPAATPESARRQRLALDLNPPSLNLGVLSFQDLAELADITLGIAGGSTRVHLGSGCPATAAGNWGTPLSPGGSCGAYLPVVVVRGSLEVTGGEGQGVLVVDGGASFLANATFAGLVLATQAVRLADDARVAGWIRSGDRVLLEGRALVEASACAGLRALSHAGLRTMRALPAGSWLEPV
ncbi:MAG: hypothetical protein OXR82_13435 [Gammaproteobacteria bacterium]|nr:hypothetical protein [Gammaproteobacteria bacterium]MDE0259372.1 hypothetical protein [Gammaproteobacteria bacterium]